MNYRRIAATFRALRIKKGWRQEDLAIRAGVSRATISRVEHGRLAGVSLGQLVRVADALDIRLDIVIRWEGGELDRLLNARHSALHESVARAFNQLAAWIIAPEVSFSVFGERGTIDLLAWHPATRALLVIELKTEIVDVNELMGSIDQKRRLAAGVARARDWDPLAVSAWVIVAVSSTNRRRVGAHSTTLRAAFPADGRSMAAWLRNPAQPVAALSFWSYARQTSSKQRLATVKRVRRPRKRAA
ncbi:MAG: helix-turn-helix transcriptional regulator [Chloroflexota bacterium]|nr:helix-turn-helix transcriptional regulator [Chloroflexota bacterium]